MCLTYRCGLYIRVSSEEQARWGDSIRDQEVRGREYVAAHRELVLQGIYIDDGVSGQKLQREDFSRLMADVQAGKIQRILFTKLDRWFRSLRHYLNTQAVLEEHGVSWTAIDQPYFDTSTPHGRAFVAQSMMWAELEAQNDGLRVRDVFASKIRCGEAITGKVPRGYQIADKHLVLSPEAPAVYDGFQYFLRTQSLRETLRYLHNQHGMDMSLQNLRQSVLSNPKYTGCYRGNPHYCPRLVSDEDFARIQEILSRNRNIRGSQRYDYLFSGLLVCGSCGRQLSACQISVSRRRKDGSLRRYRYPAYRCPGHTAGTGCPNGGEIREGRIEGILLRILCPALEGLTVRLREAGRQPLPDTSAAQARLQKKLERLKALYLDGALPLAEYREDRFQLERQQERLKEAAGAATCRKHLPLCSPPASARELLLAGFAPAYRQLSNREKRRFWREVLREIHISPSQKRQRHFEVIFR